MLYPNVKKMTNDKVNRYMRWSSPPPSARAGSPTK